MATPILTEQISSERAPVFLADPDGLFLEELIALLAREFLPIALTRKSINNESVKGAIIIHYWAKIPKIPDNAFQAIYCILGESDDDSFFLALLQEAKRRDIPLYLLAPLSASTSRLLQKVLAYEASVVFFYGEIVDDSSFVNPSSELVSGASKRNEVVLAQRGLQKLYPVTKAFVLETIIRYSLVEKPMGNALAIVPKGEFYAISLARVLQQLNPLLRITFSTQKTVETEWHPSQDWQEIYQPHDQLKEVLRHQLSMPSLVKETKQNRAKGKRSPLMKLFFSIVFSVSIIFSLLLFFTVGMAFFGERFLLRALSFSASFQFKQAEQTVVFAKDAFAISKRSLEVLSPSLSLTPLEKPVQLLMDKIILGEQVTVAMKQAVDGAEILTAMVGGSRKIQKDELAQGIEEMKSSLLTLSQLQGEGGLPNEAQEQLGKYQKLIDTFLASTDVLPNILGFENEKKYLLLFQNNNELRPGGGFIGSYAVVAVSHGRFGTIHVQDVYDADGKLKGHVEPPGALKKYLGVAHWFLRDSNFSPDFPEDAANAAFFLNLETGEKVDGVVAVDTAVLKELVKIVGPLTLSDGKTIVTEGNVISLTQEKVEKDFFPGSTQKKVILGEIYEQILMKLGEKGSQTPLLLEALNAALLQKHIVVALADSKLQYPFSLVGVSSTLQTIPAKGVIENFFGSNEANVGTNKVNDKIIRQFHYDVNVLENHDITTTVTETIENTSKSGEKFSGDYASYFRYLLPEDVSPEEILIDGVKQVVLAPSDTASVRGKVPENTLEVERVDVKGKATYGFFLRVPQGKKRTITLSYTLHPGGAESVSQMHMVLFKQPGTGPDPYIFRLILPETMRLLSSQEALRYSNGSYALLSRLASDQIITLQYGEK